MLCSVELKIQGSCNEFEHVAIIGSLQIILAQVTSSKIEASLQPNILLPIHYTAHSKKQTKRGKNIK
jgi:hypothetical protein